jgi:hypothetical protein
MSPKPSPNSAWVIVLIDALARRPKLPTVACRRDIFIFTLPECAPTAPAIRASSVAPAGVSHGYYSDLRSRNMTACLLSALFVAYRVAVKRWRSAPKRIFHRDRECAAVVPFHKSVLGTREPCSIDGRSFGDECRHLGPAEFVVVSRGSPRHRGTLAPDWMARSIQRRLARPVQEG